MQLTNEQIEFLDMVCFGEWKLNSKGKVDVKGSVNMRDMNLTEIPVKFGRVEGYFACSSNKLISLKNSPNSIIGKFEFHCSNNNLTDYFKNIKEEDFPHWNKVHWWVILKEYPFLINIAKKYLNRDILKGYLFQNPQTKLYLK